MTARLINVGFGVVRAMLCMTAVTLTAQGQARDLQAQPPPSGAGAISGIVREPNGTPVRRAKVTASGDMRLDRSVLTDDDGRFQLNELPAGRFTITTEKPGFPRMSYGATLPFRAGAGVFLKDGQTLRDLQLTLAPGAVLTGTVYDPNGEPMPGVGVMAWEIRTSLAGDRTLDFPATGGEWVTTDDRGRYRIYGLPSGQYTLGTYWAFRGQDVRMLTAVELEAAFSRTPGSAPLSSLPADVSRSSFSPVFAPGVTDPLTAATYSLGPGDERSGVDLRMQLVPMSSIEATITGPDGAPVESRLSLIRRSAVGALNTSSEMPSAGAVYRSSSLSPGPYTLLSQIAATATTPVLWASSDFVLAPGAHLRLSLTLQPAATARARIRFTSASGAPPPKDYSRVSVWLRLINDRGPDALTTFHSGEAVISGVIPGRYVVTASVPAGIANGVSWTVGSVKVGGMDVTDRPFEVGAGGPEDIEITFTDQVTELSGTISAGASGAATDFFVIALPADRAYWLPISNRRIVSTRPDGQGRYVFRNLPPGEYRLALTTDLIPRDLQDTAALERLAASSAPFTLRAGEKQTLDLKAAR